MDRISLRLYELKTGSGNGREDTLAKMDQHQASIRAVTHSLEPEVLVPV